MNLLIHEILHLVIGIGLGLLCTRVGRWPGVLSWTLVSSLLLDIDHWVDYLRTVGPRWDTKALTTGSYFVSSGRVMVLLHSWELAAVLVLSGLLAGNRRGAAALLGLGVGMLGHVLLDQIWYRQPLAAYFLVARWLHGFRDPLLW